MTQTKQLSQRPKPKLIVDTHIAIWDIINHKRLHKLHKQLLDSKKYQLCLCGISLWEIAMLVGKNRLKLNQSVEVFCQDLILFRRYKILGLKPHAAQYVATHLTKYHGDPADRIIVATALAEQASLLSYDRKIAKVYDLKLIID